MKFPIELWQQRLHSLSSRFDQFAGHAVQIHFRVTGLETAAHRSLGSPLAFRGTRIVEEEIRIATEVFRWRESDPIDSPLDPSPRGGWKAGNAMSKRLNENTSAAETIRRWYGTTFVLDRGHSDPIEINNKTAADLTFWMVWNAANGA